MPHHLQIQNRQQRELLRFSTTHINVGDGPLQIRGGGQVTDCEIDDEAHTQCAEAMLPQGDYYLVNEADPVDHRWDSDEGSNLTWVRFRLDRSSGANPSVIVLGTSECQPAIICAQFKGNPG